MLKTVPSLKGTVSRGVVPDVIQYGEKRIITYLLGKGLVFYSDNGNMVLGSPIFDQP